MSLPADAMSDAVPGQDVEFDAPTLSELKAAHDWHTEHRDRHEPGDGALPVDVCAQCGHEETADSRGRTPDCEVREIPSYLVETAKRHGLLPVPVGAREDSMAGVPAGTGGSDD